MAQRPQRKPWKQPLPTETVILTAAKVPVVGFFERWWWLPAMLAAALYAGTYAHEMVLDDGLVLLDNTHIEKGFGGISELFVTNYGHGHGGFNDGLYRPLSLVFYAIEFGELGLGAGTAHLVQALLYGLCVLLLLLWLRRWLPATDAFFVALLFAAHPLHTEVVANLKSLDELLAFLFLMLALVSAQRYAEHRRIVWLVGFFSAYVLSLFSKESAVSFIAVVALAAYYGRFTVRSSFTLLAAAAAATALFLVARFKVLSAMGKVDSGVSSLLQNVLSQPHSLGERLATAAQIQWLYFQKMVWPWPLSHDYSFNAIPLSGFSHLPSAMAFVGIVALVGLSVWGLWRRRPWAFGAGFYFVTIAVVANVFVVIGAMAAERFLFTPLLGFVLVLMALSEAIPAKWRNVSLGALALVWAGLTLARVPDWKTNFDLFTTDVAVADQSARAHYNAGTVYEEKANASRGEQVAEYHLLAQNHLRKAIAIWPDYQDAVNNLGISLMNSGNLDSAYAVYNRLLAKYPSYKRAHYNLGSVCYNLNKYTEAERHFEAYAEHDPLNNNALYLLLDCEGFQGKMDEALEHCDELIAREPNNSRGYLKKGMGLAMLGRLIEAETALTTAVEKGPGVADNYFSLGSVQEGLGKMDAALANYKKCLSLNGQHEPALMTMQRLAPKP